MVTTLKLRTSGPQAWRLVDPVSGNDVGGIRYEHAADGNHYQPWVIVDGVARDLDAPLPQLAMAARAIAAAVDADR